MLEYKIGKNGKISPVFPQIQPFSSLVKIISELINYRKKIVNFFFGMPGCLVCMVVICLFLYIL